MFRKNTYLKVTFTILFTSLFYLPSITQNWDIPIDKKAKNSYIKFDKATAIEGETIYTKNCQSCHGNPSKNNSLKTLKPVPPDLSCKQTQERTDGDLFYILTTGRLIMPSFKNILTEEDRWKLISYIRSFNNKYVQVLSKMDPTKSKLVKINFDFDSVTNKLNISIKANEKTGIIPLVDAEVVLFANRYFGKLQIDKTLRTSNDGLVSFNFPKDLPGDTSGNLEIIVKVNHDTYGEIESEQKLKIGVPTNKPSLTEKRAIWNVLTKAPIWLIITFTSIVLVVGAFLLYIIYSLVKLKKSGNN